MMLSKKERKKREASNANACHNPRYTVNYSEFGGF